MTSAVGPSMTSTKLKAKWYFKRKVLSALRTFFYAFPTNLHFFINFKILAELKDLERSGDHS